METITNNVSTKPQGVIFGALFWTAGDLLGYEFMVGFDLEYFRCEVQR